MNRWLWVLLVMLASSAGATDIVGLNGEFKTLATELPKLNAVMSDTTDTNVRLKKEYDLYLDDQKQKLAALEAAKAEVTRTVKQPMEEKVTATVNDYHARCNRTFNRETEMDQYNQCVADKERIEQDNAAASAYWDKYVVDWNRANVDPVNAVILKQNARIAEIDGLMKENFKNFLDAQDRFRANKKRLDAIVGEVRAYCDNKPAPAGGQFTYDEWVKWCSNVDWDGARASLPPMYSGR
jgi:hypothetical protein